MPPPPLHHAADAALSLPETANLTALRRRPRPRAGLTGFPALFARGAIDLHSANYQVGNKTEGKGAPTDSALPGRRKTGGGVAARG